MKRKTFIQKSSLALAGGLLSSQWACSASPNNTENSVSQRTNWAGNYTYQAKDLYEPSSFDEIPELVKKLNKQKALGSRHCFNNIADSVQSQVSLKKLNKVVEINGTSKTITVQGGARYGDFSEELHAEGFALHNLASLPHITVPGACATGTHGSGIENGNLATAVRSVELVRADGDIVTIDRGHPDFHAVVVGLGAFGIITRITLDIQPTFDVQQYVFLDMPLSSVRESFEEIMACGYSVSLFTNWMDQKVSEVWVKRRVDEVYEPLGKDYFGAKAATKNIHPIAELSAESCTEQLGVPGPWYDRLPHFKMGFTPSAGEELQSEYFVPFDRAVEAILKLEEMRDEIYPHLMISEIRAIAADDFWMSPCYQQDSIALHFTWKQKPKEVMGLLPKIESVLSPFNVKPHWGKLFTLDPDTLRSRYDRIVDFQSIRNRYDPDQKFVNKYLDLNIV